MPVHRQLFQNAPIASVVSPLSRTKVRSYGRRRFVAFAAMLAVASLGIVGPATAQLGGNPATSVVSGKLGMFTHYIPYASNISGYNAVVNAFDVNAYANDVATSGAKYVTFTLGQNGYFCAPNNTLNSLCGTVTTTRDLISEIADALNAKGIRLIVYIPSDAPDIMKSGTGYQATGRNQVFQENWQNVMREYSQRWGTKVAGWWVDGMYRWEEMYAFAQPPNHQSFAAALKAGNASAILAFNDGRGPYSNHSQYGDWTAGEIYRADQSIIEAPGRWTTNTDPVTGNTYQLQWSLTTYLGHNFVGGPAGPNDTPRFSNDFVINYIKRTTAVGGTVLFDVPIHMGGGTDPNPSLQGHIGTGFLSQLQAIGQALVSGTAAPSLGPNLVSGKATTASSSFDSSTLPAKGNDGNINSIWASDTVAGTTKWWQVDLGSAQRVDAIQLVLPQSDNRDFLRQQIQVQASDDPNFGSYDLISNTVDINTFFLPEFSTFSTYVPNPVSRRYLRVTRPPQDSYWGPTHLQVSEFRAFTAGSGGGGPVVPGAPTGITASAGNAQVVLNWGAVSGATSYSIFRGTTSGGQSSTPIVSGITATTYTNTGLTNGTTYYYYVKAVNSAGSSAPSLEISARPQASPAVPGAPTGLAAVAGNAQIALSWNASSGATSYSIFRGTTANGEATTPIVTGVTGTSYTNTGLTNGTTYYYKIKAVNSTGSSGYSNEASAKPTVPTSNGINLSASLVSGQVRLSWTSNVPNVAYYTVYRGTTSGGQGTTPLDYPGSSPWADNFSPTPGTRYYYIVRAVDIYGNTSAPSNEVNITP